MRTRPPRGCSSPADRIRLTEEVLHESVDSRTESLIALRELGPPDLVHLLKQSSRNQSKQVRFPAYRIGAA